MTATVCSAAASSAPCDTLRRHHHANLRRALAWRGFSCYWLRVRRLTLVVLATAAACTDSGSTVVPFAPDVIAANINAATGPITSPVFTSFTGLASLIQVAGTSPTAPYFPDSLRGRTFTWHTTAKASAFPPHTTPPARRVRVPVSHPD